MVIFSQYIKNYFKQCANRELLQVHQRFVCDIKKRKVIQMTICVHTINGLIRIKNSTRLWSDNIWLITDNLRSHRMITTALAMNSFVCSEKIVIYFGDHLMNDCCHALEIFFKLNKDHFTIANWFECKSLHVVLIRGQLAIRLLDRKQELISKFSKWTIMTNNR